MLGPALLFGAALYYALKQRNGYLPFISVRATVNEDVLFVFRDAGETLALLPLAEQLAVDAGHSVAIIVCIGFGFRAVVCIANALRLCRHGTQHCLSLGSAELRRGACRLAMLSHLKILAA